MRSYPPLQGCDGDAGLFHIVKRHDRIPDDLPAFMPLARDQQRVTRLQHVDAAQDRLGAVGDLGQAVTTLRTGQNGGRRLPR